jgi:uncharacterized lipoprotein YmbA
MKTILSTKWLTAILMTILLVTLGCSSAPVTEYYTLIADTGNDTIVVGQRSLLKDGDNIGVGPLIIPNSLENFSVISTANNHQMLINPYQLWAGNLKKNISQVLADDISSHLGIDGVWAFPWDNRNRPKIQVRIVFEHFSGELGKMVTLKAKWTLLSEYGRKEIKTDKTEMTQILTGSNYLDYIKGLNTLLNRFSLQLAEELNSL